MEIKVVKLIRENQHLTETEKADVISRIERIMHGEDNCNFCKDSDNLIGLMTWAFTAEGHPYWEIIEDIMKGNRP